MYVVNFTYLVEVNQYHRLEDYSAFKVQYSRKYGRITEVWLLKCYNAQGLKCGSRDDIENTRK